MLDKTGFRVCQTTVPQGSKNQRVVERRSTWNGEVERQYISPVIITRSPVPKSGTILERPSIVPPFHTHTVWNAERVERGKRERIAILPTAYRLPTMTDTDITTAAKAFGRLGGQSKSQRKQEASRANAAKARAAAKARREAKQPTKEDEG